MRSLRGQLLNEIPVNEWSCLRLHDQHVNVSNLVLHELHRQSQKDRIVSRKNEDTTQVVIKMGKDLDEKMKQ